MIYTKLTNNAMRIAYAAHHGATDYNGVPYIFHPIHLAEQMDDEVSCCAALLHDVVEDTAVTLDELRRSFPEEVIEVVDLLTHKNGVDYFDYVRNIGKHPIAKKVKLADLNHNLDQTRCVGTGLSDDRLKRWRDKYQKAMAVLENEDDEMSV